MSPTNKGPAGNWPGARMGDGQRMTLPAEYADLTLNNGLRLLDVLGRSFFQGLGRNGDNAEASARRRRLAERRAQAGRLNQTRAVLTGAQGVAGPANVDRRGLSGG